MPDYYFIRYVRDGDHEPASFDKRKHVYNVSIKLEKISFKDYATKVILYLHLYRQLNNE